MGLYLSAAHMVGKVVMIMMCKIKQCTMRAYGEMEILFYTWEKSRW